MYFRVMALLRREKRSWNGEDDELGNKNKKAGQKLTKERMRIIEEDRNTVARMARLESVMVRCRIGAEKRRLRHELERKDEIRRMQAAIRRAKLEDSSVRTIQRIWRGYYGRLNVRNWAVKKAEWDAMKVVMQDAALNIQRVFRGHLGRQLFHMKRIEISQFIAIVRWQEADFDEWEYWKTHPWSRFKRDQWEWFKKKSLFKIVAGQRVLGEPMPELMDKEWRDKMLLRMADNDQALANMPDDGIEDDRVRDLLHSIYDDTDGGADGGGGAGGSHPDAQNPDDFEGLNADADADAADRGIGKDHRGAIVPMAEPVHTPGAHNNRH